MPKVVSKILKDLLVKFILFIIKVSKDELHISPLSIKLIFSSPNKFPLTSNNFNFLSYFNTVPKIALLIFPSSLLCTNNFCKYKFLEMASDMSLNDLSPNLFPPMLNDINFKVFFSKMSIKISQLCFPNLLLDIFK